jgi:ABC-type multidrug transport system fused ATPase/permease subunit
MRRRTTIIVSHRVSTVRHADLIVVLDQADARGAGTHDELVRRGGLLRATAPRQQLQEELAAS